MDELAREAMVDDVLEVLRFELSMDTAWRRRLFAATPGERFVLDGALLDDIPPTQAARIRDHGLQIAVWVDGHTDAGDVVFAFGSPEFPDQDRVSVNNPSVL